MSIANVIEYLRDHIDHTDITLHKGVSESLISEFERALRVTLPDDIKQFYKFSNGFESVEDIFNIVTLEELIDSNSRVGERHLYIAEYMIYSDMWELEMSPINHHDYKIFNMDHNEDKIVLTNSFAEFIQRFLNGGVFNPGGLYKWNDEIKLKS